MSASLTVPCVGHQAEVHAAERIGDDEWRWRGQRIPHADEHRVQTLERQLALAAAVESPGVDRVQVDATRLALRAMQ
jgi:hypothetical protein